MAPAKHSVSVYYDRGVVGGIALLLLATPLAFGSVHAWAFSCMEAVIFALVVVWMIKSLVSEAQESSAPRLLGVPLLLFIGYVLLQLVPLPPSLLAILSPATYALYAHSFPGWPEQIPYVAIRELSANAWWRDTLDLWRPLSLAPAQTTVELLKLCAYGCFFFLIALYPLDAVWHAERRRRERRFLHGMIALVLCSAVVVASLGIAQWLSWNGKILWFFTPQDWQHDLTSSVPRASGPFVNPDHFANYVALAFPLALVGVRFPDTLSEHGQRYERQLLCIGIAGVLFVALLLSGSRSAWLTTVVSLAVVLWKWGRWFSSPFAGVAVGVSTVLVAALLVIGPTARQQLETRVVETAAQAAKPQQRLAVWLDTAPMVRDFPLFGVGLGAWPELFPRYQRPPWRLSFYREAHNDFLELLSEVGIVGTALLGWFLWRVGQCLVHACAFASVRPLALALLLSAGTMAAHAFFNFTLQIPANALLFTALLALTVRISRNEMSLSLVPARSTALPRPLIFAVGAVAGVLLIAALTQQAVPYPLLVRQPTSLNEARDLILTYPARAAGHHALLQLLGPTAPVAQRQREIEITLGLEPLNPALRDQYAAMLWQAGNEEAALAELSRSVAWSPQAETHAYIETAHARWLSAREQQAIEAGFLQAVQAGYTEATAGLSTFYAALGRTADEAAIYENTAETQTVPGMKASFLLRAAGAYMRGNDLARAEGILRQVITLTPGELQPYRQLVLQVLAPRKQFVEAKQVLEEGQRNGVDPYTLALISAEAAQVTGANDEQHAALQQAVYLRPRSFDAHLQLGLYYLREQKFDRAALALRQAVALDPRHAPAMYHLGVAEEGRYQFFAAEQAYMRAIELDRGNAEFQQRVQRFRAKMTKTQSTR